MHRTQSASIPGNQENVKIIMKCPCVGNSNYARRNDRPALANIQSDAAQRQYLTVDYGQQGKLKPTNKQLGSAESLAIPSRKSGSCVCPGRRASSTSGTARSKSSQRAFVGQVSSANSHDDVFAQPLSSTKYPVSRSVSQSRVTTSSSSRLRLAQMQADDRSSIGKTRSIEALTSTRQSTSSPALKAGCCGAIRSKSTKPHPKMTFDQHAEQESNILQSHQFVTLSQDSGYSNGTSTSSTAQYSTAGMSVENKYLTLRDEKFVTLSQDTLKTTRCSADSALINIRFTRDSSLLDENEKPFVNAKGFFHDLDNGITSTVKTIPVRSPLDLNVPPRRSNSISDTVEGGTVKKPAVKTTLRKRSSIKPQAFFPLLYSPEYSNDLISHCYKHKGNFLVKSEWVKMYVDKRARCNTANWLLQVSEFVAPQFEPVYYMSIRIFDYSIIMLKLRNGHYQLAAIVAFWIALKYLDNTVRLKVSKIYSLCSGKYSTREILSMERKILKATDFCLNIPDPLDFLYNYLKSSNLENDEVLRYGAKFVLECASLFETYALVEAPFIAASTLYMAYQILRKTSNVYINFVWYDKKVIHHYVEKVLCVKIKYAIMERYEPINKYEGSDKMRVAKMFSNI